MHPAHIHRLRAVVPVLFLSGSLAVAGCGSSSKSTSSTSSTSSASSAATSTKAAAAAAHLRVIRAVTPPAGAANAGPGTLAKLPPVAKGSVTAHLGGLGKLPLAKAVQTVSGDVNYFWSKVFAQANVRWPAMQDVIVDGQPVQTPCTSRSPVAPTDSWLLCDDHSGTGRSGGTFYWTLPWMQQNVATDQGGVNLAFHMAELWSLHILNLVGATKQLEQGSLSKPTYAQATMCLTGVYVATLNDRKLFEAGDQQTVGSFVQSLNSVEGIGAPDVSARQLQSAFVAGFKTGRPSTCGLGK